MTSSELASTLGQRSDTASPSPAQPKLQLQLVLSLLFSCPLFSVLRGLAPVPSQSQSTPPSPLRATKHHHIRSNTPRPSQTLTTTSSTTPRTPRSRTASRRTGRPRRCSISRRGCISQPYTRPWSDSGLRGTRREGEGEGEQEKERKSKGEREKEKGERGKGSLARWCGRWLVLSDMPMPMCNTHERGCLGRRFRIAAAVHVHPCRCVAIYLS
jgi:hypothetical protein